MMDFSITWIRSLFLTFLVHLHKSVTKHKNEGEKELEVSSSLFIHFFYHSEINVSCVSPNTMVLSNLEEGSMWFCSIVC